MWGTFETTSRTRHRDTQIAEALATLLRKGNIVAEFPALLRAGQARDAAAAAPKCLLLLVSGLCC